MKVHRRDAYCNAHKQIFMSNPIFTSIAAHLYVSDIQTSIDYFISRLNFDVDFVYGDPPFYAQVRRDNTLLALRHMDKPVFNEDIRQREQLLSASITVATAGEMEQLFADYKAAGVTFAQEMKDEPWHAKTFIVKDPDGNLVLFAGPAA